MTKKQKKMLARILVCAVMLIALQFLPITGIPRFALYLAAYLVIGFDILKKAAKGIGNGRVFDENFLMAVATIGAFALAIYEKSGDYNEAIAVMLFYRSANSSRAMPSARAAKIFPRSWISVRTTQTSRWTESLKRWTRTKWRSAR